MESNARKFIQAYNVIDYNLRIKYNLKRNMSFADVIRRSVSLNHIVRKYEDLLIDFGRLRNAIIHNSNENYVIAEPHDDVVIKIEHIAEIISTPPKALDTIREKDVLCAQNDVSVKEVIKLISSSGYSNIPIYKDGGLIGVANGQRILDELGKAMSNGCNLNDFIVNTTIEEILNLKTTSKYYDIVSKEATVEEILNLFYTNRKLTTVLITKDGLLKDIPVAIITTSDILEMNSILENY